MKLYDVLMVAGKNTEIKISMRMFGMKFSAIHFPEYYLENKENDELLERRVTDMCVTDNCLELVLAEK